jgi:hypothetical protein
MNKVRHLKWQWFPYFNTTVRSRFQVIYCLIHFIWWRSLNFLGKWNKFSVACVCGVISSCSWKSSQRHDTIQRFSLWSSRLEWVWNLRYFVFSCFYEGKEIIWLSGDIAPGILNFGIKWKWVYRPTSSTLYPRENPGRTTEFEDG